MNGRLFPLVLIVVALALPRSSTAESTVYSTTDPASAAASPPGPGWTPGLPPTLPHGVNFLWLAVDNDPGVERNKFVNVSLEDSILLYFKVQVQVEGFEDDTDLLPVDVAWLGTSGESNGTHFNDYYSMSPQPTWERIRLERGVGGDLDLSNLIPEINTMCSDVEVIDLDLLLGDCSFESPAGVAGSPRYNEVWVFPRNANVSLTTPSFTAPGPTGTWTSAFVYTDPDGNPRPGGGVKFSTNGVGLSVNDHFDASLRVNQPLVYLYDVYSHDTMGAGYERRRIRTGILGAPAVSIWSMAALAFATLTAGALLMRRRAEA